jgi:hypothetical protein
MSSICDSSTLCATECKKSCDDIVYEKVNYNSIQYQRLNNLRNIWSEQVMDESDVESDDDVRTRNGSKMLWANLPDISGTKSGDNLQTAWVFVQTHRYINIEKCYSDQLWGWWVDINSGELVFMQKTENVLFPYRNIVDIDTSSTRLNILNKACNELTLYDKKSLKVFNKYYELSERIIQCNRYPKTEGNIVEITDSCGQRWMIVYNFIHDSNDNNDTDSDIDDDSDYSIINRGNIGKYVFVGCKL